VSLLQTLKFITSHPLNAGHPVKALARFAKWQIESRLKDEVEFDWIEGSKLIVRNGMTGATGNIYCGLHEFADMAFVLHFLRPDEVFVDVGANIGSYTVLASAVCGAKTIAIEPDPDTMVALRKNVIVNGIKDRVTLVEAAVGSEEGTVAFTVGRDTTNKVADPGDRNTRVVNVQTLDDILANVSPALIKMDVEGYEAKVFAGACQSLESASLQAILIETVDAEVEKALKEAGFVKSFYEPFDRKLTLGVEQNSQLKQGNNSLFLRDEASTNELLERAPARSIQGVQI